MSKLCLEPNQSIRGAIIFLNTFGLKLEELDTITETSKLKIFNGRNEEVGHLTFNDEKIVINTNSSFGKITANYAVPEAIGFRDFECGNALFVQWQNNIHYEIEQAENIRFNGDFFVDCTNDPEFGIICKCHTLLNCWQDGKNIMTLKLLLDGITFGIEMTNGDLNEIIELTPFNSFNGYIKHQIIKGDYDQEKGGYPYFKYAGIIRKSDSEPEKLKALSFEKEYDKPKSRQYNYYHKVGMDEEIESVIQKGLLMQQLDPTMTSKIKQLKSSLTIDEISLLDNIISVCLESYSDDEIKALLGIERVGMRYQNNTNNLKDAYYGTGKDNKFLSKTLQKINSNK